MCHNRNRLPVMCLRIPYDFPEPFQCPPDERFPAFPFRKWQLPTTIYPCLILRAAGKFDIIMIFKQAKITLP